MRKGRGRSCCDGVWMFQGVGKGGQLGHERAKTESGGRRRQLGGRRGMRSRRFGRATVFDMDSHGSGKQVNANQQEGMNPCRLSN